MFLTGILGIIVSLVDSAVNCQVIAFDLFMGQSVAQSSAKVHYADLTSGVINSSPHKSYPDVSKQVHVFLKCY